MGKGAGPEKVVRGLDLAEVAIGLILPDHDISEIGDRSAIAQVS